MKGDKIKDWVRRWTEWIIEQYVARRPSQDFHYWGTIRDAFQNSFQDSASRERAEDKLRHLAFTPGDVDTFIAHFESLAMQALYLLDAKPTLSLFASKLPFKMMEHIYKVVQPVDFQGWADAARQYHQDNTAVQNIRGIWEDNPRRNSQPKKTSGFSAKELAKILGVKMPNPNPNAMDTRADRFRAQKKSWKTQGRASVTTTTPTTDQQRKEGRCYTCNKQGHIARNCPDKKKKDKVPVKARKGETEDSGADDEVSATEDETPSVDAFVRLGQSMKEKDKIALIRAAIEAEEGKEGENSDF
jgi:hypothetical protein